MNKINLNILAPTKTITLNGKDIKIPKLGLRHKLLINTEMGYEECIKAILSTISTNLSQAERDLVTLHILEFNDKIKSKVEVNGVHFDINDVEISQKLKFVVGDYEFKFKTPSLETMNGPLDVILKQCCVYVKYKGEKIECPDFMDMPAYVFNWIEDISTTISIKYDGGEIKGLYNIMELFNG